MQNDTGYAAPFHQHLLDVTDSIWQKTLDHPFLTAVADGSIADDVFKTWIAQDYLFVQAAIPFMGILIAKSPVHMRPALANAVYALNQELELFQKQAIQHGVDLDVEMSPTCHAYVQFLMATAYDRPLETGFAVLYGTEKAYLDAWSRVKTQQQAPGSWQAFINNWTSDAFQGYVTWLATTLDELASSNSEAHRREMEHYFVLTARYEYLFWDMALSGSTWPV